MPTAALAYGEEVVIPWGLDEVRGTVHQTYGRPPREYVVVALTPAVSGAVVGEPTTVTLPADVVKRVSPAA